MSAALVARVAISVFAGLTLGAGFFALLHANVRLYGSRRWPLALILHLARWAPLGAALLVAARSGALPLLSMTLGILVARSLVLRRARAGQP